MGRKRGFTLIEIMIVLAIIALLSVVLVPKVGAIKLQSKNKNVTTNVMLVRSYLENRSGKDGIQYKVLTIGGKTQEQALDSILKSNNNDNTNYIGIGPDMTSNFSGSNALTNPFTGNNSIVYSQGNITNKSPSSTSSLLVYYSTGNLPSDNNSVINSSMMPKGVDFKGNVVVVVYSTGYVLYGVDNSGEMVSVYIIKFPPTPPIAKSGVTPGDGDNPGGNSEILSNVEKVVAYIRSNAIEKIITGAPDNQVWPVMRTPLYSDLYNQFTPNNSSKHLVNPYKKNVDDIIDGNASWVDPSKDYSIIAYPGENISQADTKYSNFEGAVVVYITSNPLGYIVYGIDDDGNSVGRTEINLATLITSDMTNTLSNNVSSVYNILKNNVNSNLKAAEGQSGTYNKAVILQALARNQLQSLNLSNAYLPTWKGVGTDTYDFYNNGGTYKKYALVVELSEGSHYTDFKGSIIVNVLPDASGYEVYGMDYNGNRYKYVKVTSTNNLLLSNVNSIVEYLNSFDPSSKNGENKYEPYELQDLISKHFGTSITNPYNTAWNDIVLAVNYNPSRQSSVIVSDSIELNWSNYKGNVIVQNDTGSGFTYNVFGIDNDGRKIELTIVSFKK